MAVKLLTATITGRGLRHTIERGGEVGHCDCFTAPRELVEASITILEQINRLLGLRTNKKSWILGEFGADRTIVVLQKDRRIVEAAKWVALQSCPSIDRVGGARFFLFLSH